MKKIITLFSAFIVVFSIYAQTNFCDNFESYQTGDPIAQTSSDWSSWGELMSGTTAPFADDANVVNTNASSGDHSLYFVGVGTGGPQDVVLPFGSGAPYTIGDFEFSANFFVNSGTGAYFNFQAENTPGTTWSLDVQMDNLGNVSFENGGGATQFIYTNYPMGVWFEIKIMVDLTNNNWEVFIDGVSQGSFTNTVNKIASLDLYPITGHEFYVDDVCYSYMPVVLDSLNAQVSSITPITGLNGQLRNPSVEVRNLGINNITSFDVDFEYNGITITENIIGVNMTTLDVYQVDFTNTITLVAGTNTAIATVYNVNSLGQDNNPNDDVMTTQINAIIPATGKLVIGEEATGTWCQWCPRGAVALNWMDNDYEGYWQGIAVHNADPMADAIYDGGLGGSISGYPSGLVDRGTDINPAAFKQDFLQRIVIVPSGIITNGAELNGNTLKVSLTVDFQIAVSGNYKLACVIVEDSVTGSGPQWYQANAYSGGGAGSLIDVDGTDWASLPGNVPDWQMIYRHVARGISPNFNGTPLSATSYNSGDSETKCFEFTLDPSWDQSMIHIVGMLLDNSNMVDNASSTTIDAAVLGGYSACATSSTSIELNGPDKINIFPNPASESIYISNLREENTTVKIYDIKGSLVLENKVSDKQYLNISRLTKGIYQVKFEGKDWSEVRKLIKE